MVRSAINSSALEALLGLYSGHLRDSLIKVEKSISDGTIDLPRDPVSLAFTAGQAMAQPHGPISLSHLCSRLRYSRATGELRGTAPGESKEA